MNGFFNLNTHNFDSCFIMATIHDGRVVKKKSSFNQLFELKTKLGNRLLLPASREGSGDTFTATSPDDQNLIILCFVS